ncbi:hypothetical protein UlMin_015362 [Ulmus minor]
MEVMTLRRRRRRIWCGGRQPCQNLQEVPKVSPSAILGRVRTLQICTFLFSFLFCFGWTLYEILRYEALKKKNPILAKMVISGVVYSLGDWIGHCFDGKPLFEFDSAQMFRSGLVGFTLHGSLSLYYYQFYWWVVPAKVICDQTAMTAVWNGIYYIVLEFCSFIGWKLWPFTHRITYGVVLVEQRLLWVNCVELIWVTIFSIVVFFQFSFSSFFVYSKNICNNLRSKMVVLLSKNK